jgi:hypothetical protein
MAPRSASPTVRVASTAT